MVAERLFDYLEDHMSGLRMTHGIPHTAPDYAARLAALRQAMSGGRLAGFIVPKTDEFQNESVPPSSDRLNWLTGFTGSAGLAVVLQDKATLLVDSRYTLQAKAQADGALYAVEQFPKTTAASYLAAEVKAGDVIGYDPTLHTLAGFKSLKQAAEEAGFDLRPCRPNPIDALWTDRPAPVHAPIFIQEEAYSGEAAASKIARVQKAVEKKKAMGLFASAPDAVAWLFNIRGRDVKHTPLPLTRAFVPVSGKPTLFIAPGHVTSDNRLALEALATVGALDSLPELLASHLSPDAKIIADPSVTTLAIADALRNTGAKLIEIADPCLRLKAIKNKVELEGARNAHIRDGAALCRFLAWLDARAPRGGLTEIGASDKLEQFRRETNLLQDLSFDTISGAGPNGAIVHYRSTPETDRELVPGTLYLVDSGGQYRDGTTDVTRTIAIGSPSPEMRRHYTLVLKGHMAIALARFPAGTRGVDIDAFARRALWAAGLNYGHGTGHGIGSFLSVHEAPPSISPNGTAELEPGMIVSNEPGYYREGHYGIRIENLLAVTDASEIEGGETPMMGFETLTLAPFDRRLIQVELLSNEEKVWVDAYHARVWSELSMYLNDGEKAWLRLATAGLRSD